MRSLGQHQHSEPSQKTLQNLGQQLYCVVKTRVAASRSAWVSRPSCPAWHLEGDRVPYDYIPRLLNHARWVGGGFQRVHAGIPTKKGVRNLKEIFAQIHTVWRAVNRGVWLAQWVEHVILFFFFFKRLFEGERQSVSRGGAERGAERIQSRLQALSCQHRVQCGARTHEPRDHDCSQSRTHKRLSHPGDPRHYRSWALTAYQNIWKLIFLVSYNRVK